MRVPPWAEFAMLSEADQVVSIDFRRVPYDRDATVRAMIECEMPHVPHGGQRIGASKVTAAHGISSPEIDLSSSACCS